MPGSVRDYAVRSLPGGGSSPAAVVGGGGAVLGAGRHALDGPEHTAPADSGRLDATVDAHGLLPRLSGDAGHNFKGDGTFGQTSHSDLVDVDTNASTSAIHHTLGTGSTQAAAGDHTHGDGAASALTRTVSQTSHGLAVGDVVRIATGDVPGGATVNTSSADGYVTSNNGTYATAHAGSSLSVHAGSATIYPGQQTGYYLNIAYLKASLAAIPGDATITAVTLRMYAVSTRGHSGGEVYRVRAFNWGSSVDSSDWDTAYAGDLLAHIAGGDIAFAAYNDFVSDGLVAAVQAAIGGTLSMALATDKMESATAPGTDQFQDFYSGANGSNKPQLVIEWTAPGDPALGKAQADDPATAEVVGIVTDVPDADTLVLTMAGYVEGLSGLTPGSVYFLDPGTAGGLTATEPATPGQVSKPLLLADSETSGYFTNMRGLVL